MSGQDEVLRYLGHRGQQVPPELMRKIERAMAECRDIARARSVWREISADMLPGSARAFAFAATLGLEVERRIDQLQLSDITYSLVLNAAATEHIERVCDEVEAHIAALRGGLCARPRVSPGYANLPLALQPKLLGMLDAGRKIGLSCTDSLILTPRKSVTALVGFYDQAAPGGRGCGACQMNKTCEYRKEEHCEHH